MKINFSKIILTDIEGKEIKDSNIHKAIWNWLFTGAKNLDLVEIWQKIYRGEEVELRDGDIWEINEIIDKNLVAFAKKQVKDYMGTCK